MTHNFHYSKSKAKHDAARRHQRRREYHPHHHRGTRISADNTIVILPSVSNLLIDQGIQVAWSSTDSDRFHRHPHHEGLNLNLSASEVEMLHPTKHKHQTRFWKRIPNIFSTPPAEIRESILNHGETYWRTANKSSRFLAQCSGLQLMVYLLVFGLSAPHKVILGLIPVRDTLIVWYLFMSIGDILAYVVIIIGRWASKKFELSKRADTYFIMFSTFLLIINFVGSVSFPVYGSFHLVTKIEGTIITDEAKCIEARDKFANGGSDWSDISRLQQICKVHVHCVKGCRDFRDLFFWIVATYFMAIFRFCVMISLWNTCSFLCFVMDVREEHVTYTVSIPKKDNPS